MEKQTIEIEFTELKREKERVVRETTRLERRIKYANGIAWFFVGVGFAIFLTVVILLLAKELNQLELNEIGDFIGGTVIPKDERTY